MQPVIRPTSGKQFFVDSLLDNPAVIKHKNPRRLPHQGKTMSNDEGRPPSHQMLKGLNDKRFCPGIKCGRRFIEDQHRGIFQKGARDCQSLALPD